MPVVASLTHVRLLVDQTVARLAKLKISHWFNWPVSSAYQVFIYCQKHSYAALFTLLQQFSEMFIFSGKSRCCRPLISFCYLHCCWQRIFNLLCKLFLDIGSQHFISYAETVHMLLNVTVFNDLEWPLTQISRSRHIDAECQKGMW